MKQCTHELGDQIYRLTQKMKQCTHGLGDQIYMLTPK